MCKPNVLAASELMLMLIHKKPIKIVPSVHAVAIAYSMEII